MNYQDIVEANASIKTTKIKNKNYAEVNQRIKAFRMLFPEGTIETTIVPEMSSLADGVITIRTIVGTIENGEFKLLATGLAQEKESSSFINKTSFVENAETSSVGRALGMLGIGIDTSIASYEEVSNAIANLDDTPKATEEQINFIETNYEQIEELKDYYQIQDLKDLSYEQAERLIKRKS